MSVLVSTQVWHDKGIESKAELLLMLCLADFSDDDGECWPSIRSLAMKTRCDERSVQRMMERLKAKGLIEVQQNAGPRGCNLYRVVPRHWDRPPGKMPPPSKRQAPRHCNQGTPTLVTGDPGTATTRTVIEPSKNHQKEEIVDSNESTPSPEDSESASPEATEPPPRNEAAEPPPAGQPRRSPRLPPPRQPAQEAPRTSTEPETHEEAPQGLKTPPTRQGARKREALEVGPSLETVALAWNKMATAAGLPGILTATEARKRAFRSRAREEFWAANWERALSQVPVAAWRLGENDRGWRANLDWFLRPDTVAKLIEEADAAATAKQPAGKGQGGAATRPKSQHPIGSPEWEKEMLSR